MNNMRLMHNLVAIREAASDNVTASGIQLVRAEKQYQGTVVAVGPGTYATETGAFIPTTVKVGDIVAFTKKSGEVVDFGTEKLLVMSEPNIIAILKGDDTIQA